MFQTAYYCGGFDGTEMAFCFSMRRWDGEFWFQISLDQVLQVQRGEQSTIEVRRADY